MREREKERGKKQDGRLINTKMSLKNIFKPYCLMNATNAFNCNELCFYNLFSSVEKHNH